MSVQNDCTCLGIAVIVVKPETDVFSFGKILSARQKTNASRTPFIGHAEETEGILTNTLNPTQTLTEGTGVVPRPFGPSDICHEGIFTDHSAQQVSFLPFCLLVFSPSAPTIGFSPWRSGPRVSSPWKSRTSPPIPFGGENLPTRCQARSQGCGRADTSQVITGIRRACDC